MSEWSVVYRKAINDDGSLLFPERLTKEFLEKARRSMGSYLFANQYQNEVIPEDAKSFRPEWIKFYSAVPSHTYSFGFIDPAIGQDKHHDYTGIVIVDVTTDGSWYVRYAKRARLTPTQIISEMFRLCDEFKLKALGVEIVAYQEALLYFLDQEMRRTQRILPVKGIRRSNVSKNTRILGLVPRFEWGRIFVSQGMTDFEDEYRSFPRGAHDDILDALASLEELVYYPQELKQEITKPHSANDPNYEKWAIQQMQRRAKNGEEN